MITSNELYISNKSYTNKDFQTIFPELLDFAKSLSLRWDPTATNESDPLFVLLKLIAFIGDKNNYNIDKNVLELFMPSATQETSMRNLCEMNGYTMSYYMSAITTASFVYRGDALDVTEGEVQKSFKLPKFTTTITDIDNTVVYTLIDDCIIVGKNVEVQGKVIQGTVTQLSIGDSTVITASSLDDNNRIYIPAQNASQNGVFIYNNEDLSLKWERVDNLNIQSPGTLVYKFGYDSSQKLPYIEFPNDIVNLIKSGLNIWYTVGSGVEGNISANVLYKISSNTTFDIIGSATGEKVDVSISDDTNTSDLVITNLSASVDGANPETIDEAYNAFKKTIGTFNTLVTSRDYANAIYNLISSITLKNCVSNAQVTDRRTDINYSNNYITLDNNGIHSISVPNYNKMNPFSVNVYALNPITSGYTLETYIKSFQPIGYNTFIEIESLINDNKNLAVTLCNPIQEYNNDKPIFLIKNYYKLNGKIATTNKVTSYESQQIINNVKLALMKQFNSRQVDYGYEIPYETIVFTIENADERIKLVNLLDPEVTTKCLIVDSDSSTGYSEVNYFDDTINNYYLNTVATKNVLAGRIELFEKDTRFPFMFGQSLVAGKGPIINNLIKMDTTASISSTSLVNGYTLQENEVIQMIAPNLTSELSYTYGVNYLFTSSTTDSIAAETEYQLKAGETLRIYYTDSTDKPHYIEYIQGDIIKPNFKLVSGEAPSTALSIPVIWEGGSGESQNFYQLGVEEKIEKRRIASNDIKYNNVVPTQLVCFWIRKNTNNELFVENDAHKDSGGQVEYYETVLNADEYFIYTNVNKTELVILGSGTKLRAQGMNGLAVNQSWQNSNPNNLTIESISTNGIGAFDNLDWKYINNTQFTATEMQILTLSSGDTIQISAISSDLTNAFTPIDSSSVVTYTILGQESQQLPQYMISGMQWQIKSRLDVKAGLGIAQRLYDNQIVTLYSGDVSSPTSTTLNGSNIENYYLSFSEFVDVYGDDDIDLSVTNLQSSQPEYTLSVYFYNQSTISYGDVSNIFAESTSQNLYSIKIDSNSGPLTLPFIKIENESQIFALYYNKSSDLESESLTISSNNATGIRLYNSGNEFSNSVQIEDKGLVTIEINTDSDISQIIITPNNPSGTTSILLSSPCVFTGLNSILNLSQQQQEALLANIKTQSNNNFYYLYTPDNSSVIDVDDLSAPESLWNSNNVCNLMVLGEIDLTDANFNISIVKSSQV